MDQWQVRWAAFLISFSPLCTPSRSTLSRYIALILTFC